MPQYERNAAKALVHLLYRIALRREPDQAGLDHYSSVLMQDGDVLSILLFFADGAKFRSLDVTRFAKPRTFYSPIVNPEVAAVHYMR